MEKLSVKKVSAFFAVMIALMLVSVVGIVWNQRSAEQITQENTDKLVIYPESGFYNEDVTVRITAPKGAVIRYSLDCKIPTADNGQVYEKSFVLPAEEEEQAYVLRVKAYMPDGSESRVYTRTYFCGQEIRNRYTTTVVSIVGEPDGLFGYENGILVNGKRYDAFMEAHPGAHPGGGVEANFTMRGMEAERPVSIEMFLPDGEQIIEQQGGVRVAGELSRLNNHKSLRLYARSEYDKENEFDYDFFGDLKDQTTGTMGKTYKRLLLKNSGQDYGYGFVRTELVGKLADQAGFPDTQHVSPACVYINGEYYGSYWLANSFDEEYFVNRYGEHEGSFVVIESGDREKVAAPDADLIEKQCVEEYNEAYNRFAQMDLTDDNNYAALQEFMDVENYLQYFAIENYVGNDDWPDANVKAYRYIAGEEGYGEGVYDGRYRMLLFDADFGFGLLFYHETIGCLVNEMTLDKIMYERSPLFAALMEREDCRAYFTSYTMDLSNGAMNVGNVSEQVDKLHASRTEELARTLAVEGLVGGFLLDSDSINMDTVAWNIERIKAFAAERPNYVMMDIAEKFHYDQIYHLMLSSESSDAMVQINTAQISAAAFEGIYLKEIPVTMKPILKPGEIFVGWIVNGESHSEEELVITGSMIAGDTIAVELVTAPMEDFGLQLSAFAAKGNADYVELTNFTQETLSTSGYYLSDEEDAYLYALPVQLVGPGETIRLVGKNNDSLDSLGQYVMNFDLKEGEALTLTYMESLLQCVEIPNMSRDGVMVYNRQTDRFEEQKREQ